MIDNIKIFCIATLLFATSCNSNDTKEQEEKEQVDDNNLQSAKPVNKFADIVFASQKDTICDMPISAGVEDTLILKGKVYGFCSPECKADFIVILKNQHKR